MLVLKIWYGSKTKRGTPIRGVPNGSVKNDAVKKCLAVSRVSRSFQVGRECAHPGSRVSAEAPFQTRKTPRATLDSGSSAKRQLAFSPALAGSRS